MSGTAMLTVGGAFDGHTGVLSVPSSLSSSTNSILQTYLDGLSGSVTGGSATFENDDVAAGVVDSVAGSGTNFFEEITNTDSVGATTGGSAAGVVSVTAGVTNLVAQDPGSVTVAGVSSTLFALFGANSNVAYSVDGGAGSIFAAGGNDSIFVAGSAQDTVASAGNDTINFNGTNGSGVIDATGNATTRVYVGGSDVATVTASGNSQASVVFLPLAGGNLDFINNSSAAQTIYSGSFTTAGGGSIFAVNAVTAFGGSGGGFFVGGRGGFNVLNGGTGDSTLVGGGAGDILTTGGQQNFLYTGSGAETLIGGGVNNGFSVGLEDVGIGTVKAVGDLVSAGGSGAQNFVLGQLSSTTLTGSTVTGASNTYAVLGTFTTTGGEAVSMTGGDFTITDFGASDNIFLLNGSNDTGAGAPSVETVQSAIGGGGSQILLTDGTVITLKGVAASDVKVGFGGHQISLQ
jgi:hypothetical protein